MLDIVHDPSGSFEKSVEPGARYPEFACHLLNGQIRLEKVALHESTGALEQGGGDLVMGFGEMVRVWCDATV